VKNLRNQVVPVLLLLETAEGHLGAGDVLLGVLEVREQGVVVPLDALLLVGVGVRVALDGARLAAEETVQGRADLVAAAGLDGVALGATGLEEVGTLLSVSCKGGASVGHSANEILGRAGLETVKVKLVRRSGDAKRLVAPASRERERRGRFRRGCDDREPQVG
jgi:hypothetical protein